jgi:hypothetical protein
MADLKNPQWIYLKGLEKLMSTEQITERLLHPPGKR